MIERFRRRDSQGDDRGFALITVLLATMALMALGTAAVAYGLGSQNASRRDQDWNASLTAAEAGIDDYVFRLNENSNYYAVLGHERPDRRQRGLHRVATGRRARRTSRASTTRSTPPSSRRRGRS